MKQKYSKWVVGAASAALVASAIVPAASAASFSDIEKSDHKDAILALADAKIVAGYPDGTFKPNAVVTRGNVTKFLGKWLVSENYEVPADYATEARFTDLPTTTPDKELLQYAALVKDAGVFKGSNNQLMHTNNMSREQMAVVLVRAIKTVYNVDLVADYKEDDFETTITDLEKATAKENREAIVALEYAGLTNVTQFNPKNTLTRGQFASFLHRTITNIGEEASLTVKEVKVVDATTLEVTLSDDKKHTVTLPTPLPENKETKVEFEIDGKTYSAEVTYVTAVKVKSVDAVNAKTLAVTFNKPVETEKAKFELKKDGFKSNFSSITWNEEKTVATVELTSKITKGEFTVNVTGLSEEALTGSVKTEDEKVSAIEILGEVAPSTGDTTATIGYQIKNQYGEDITKLNASSLTLSAAGATNAVANADGSITITKAGLKEGDKVVLTVIHGATATTATQTVTISAKTVASDVTIGALYNKDGKTLNEDTNLAKDKFYLPVTVKDQYGKEVTDVNRLNGELLVTNTNQAVATFGTFEKQTIEGKDVVVLPVTNIVATGDTNVIAIAKATGKNGQAVVKVAEGLRTDSVTLGAPTKVVTADADILFPLSVLDKQGNAIKDTTVLSGSKGISITGGTLVEKDGELYAKVAGANVKENTPVTVVVTSSTGKVATQTVIPKSTTTPKVITGLNSKVSTAIREIAGEKVEIAAKDIVVEDQFGQVISTDELLAKLATAGYTIKAFTDNDAPFTVTGEIKDAANNKITVEYKAGATKTTANVTFKLVKVTDDTAIEASSYSKQFSVVKDSSFTSYKVEDIKPIYVTEKAIPTGYGKDIVVKAVTANGGEVTLKAGSDFTVKSTVLTNVADGNITTGDAANVEFDKDAKTATAKVTITINATGEEIVKEVTFSNVAPKVEKVAVVEEGKATQYIAGEAVNFVTTSSYNVATNFNLDAFFKLADVVVTDQYGVMASVAEADAAGEVKGQAKFNGVPTAATTLTLSKVSGEVVFSNNGTAEASATGKAGDVFNARVNIGGQSADLVKVTAKQDFKN